MSNTIAPAKRCVRPLCNQRWLQQFARRIVRSVLARVRYGRLEVRETFPKGEVHIYGFDGSRPVVVRVDDCAAYAAMLIDGDVGASDAFIDGLWECDDIAGLIELLLVNYSTLSSFGRGASRLTEPLRRIAYWLQQNTRRGSRKNIEAHYDLSNEFFQEVLDPSMMYSCGYFGAGVNSLESAQWEKNERICRKLDLGPDDHLVEIGTGWGGFSLHAASRFGCRVTTTTISQRQYDMARHRIDAAGMQDRIDLLMVDYRDLRGQFDKLVSIEMIEAVGAKFLGDFFATCDGLLKPDGLALIQAITIRDQFHQRASRRMDFLKKYIFPGSCLLSVEAMQREVARRTDMKVFHLEDIGPYYIPTLQAWRDRFLANVDRVQELGFDDSFVRLWLYYLGYCEGAFAARHAGDVQMLLVKPLCRREPLQLDSSQTAESAAALPTV